MGIYGKMFIFTAIVSLVFIGVTTFHNSLGTNDYTITDLGVSSQLNGTASAIKDNIANATSVGVDPLQQLSSFTAAGFSAGALLLNLPSVFFTAIVNLLSITSGILPSVVVDHILLVVLAFGALGILAIFLKWRV